MGHASKSPKALMVQSGIITTLVAPAVSLHEPRVHVIVMEDGQLEDVGSDYGIG